MRSFMRILVAAALIVAADEPTRGNVSPPPLGSSFATESTDISSNQDATDDVIRVTEINSNQKLISAGVRPRLVLGRGRTFSDVVTTRAAGIRLTLIPTGTFLMGLPDEDADNEHKPQHEVRISAHSIWA